MTQQTLVSNGGDPLQPSSPLVPRTKALTYKNWQAWTETQWNREDCYHQGTSNVWGWAEEPWLSWSEKIGGLGCQEATMFWACLVRLGRVVVASRPTHIIAHHHGM